MTLLALPCLACLLLTAAVPARAGVIINVVESEHDVVATGWGSLNTGSFTLSGTSGVMTPVINGAWTDIYVGPVGAPTWAYTGTIAGPSSFGSSVLSWASSGTGDSFGLIAVNGWLNTPANYVSGDPLSGTATWSGATFASLGLTPGQYVWTWGENGTADSLTLNIGTPEPGTAGLLALAGVAWTALRRLRPGGGRF
jgi:hypothetical protein